jgi:tetrahedral aminopeptidase
MSVDIDLLARICEAPGPPGYERMIRQLVIRELDGLADEIRTDSIGNVIALKKGRSSAKKVMAAAHMDEIGFIVTHVDDKGFVRFNPVGGFDPKTLTSQRVIIHGRKDVFGVMGSKPVHIMSPEEKNKTPQIKDYFIDTGCRKRHRQAGRRRGFRHPPLAADRVGRLRERQVARQPRFGLCVDRNPALVEKVEIQAGL